MLNSIQEQAGPLTQKMNAIHMNWKKKENLQTLEKKFPLKKIATKILSASFI